MGTSEAQSFERLIKHIEELGIDLEVHFDNGNTLLGKVSYVGSDFFELEIVAPGVRRKAVCPFWSVQYLMAEYENPKQVLAKTLNA